MDNGQMPQVQPVQPAEPNRPTNLIPTANGMPMVQQVQVVPEKGKDVAGLIKTIALIVVSLIAVTFIGLFIWMRVEYNGARSDVEGEIDAAVANAKDQQIKEMEAEFLEREKYPYRTFLGPSDYGQLSFEYPKTWSVYIAADAANGGDFQAYFNPVQVEAVGKDTINALRVSIRDKNFDDVVSEYQRAMDRKDSGLTVESVVINGVAANRYTGKIPDTDLNGYIVIFKIRDKTAILQTDSVLFREDFDNLVNTITFNA